MKYGIEGSNFKTVESLSRKWKEYVEPLFEGDSTTANHKVESYISKVEQVISDFAAPIVGIGSFDYKVDVLNLINGLANGAVNVLPSNSMVRYCKNNVSDLYPAGFSMYNYLMGIDIYNTLV